MHCMSMMGGLNNSVVAL